MFKKHSIFRLLHLLVLGLFCSTSSLSNAQQMHLGGAKTHDLYAFRSPDNDNTVTIIATFNEMQNPQAGNEYKGFDVNSRYEIHVENDGTAGDDITYRFTFTQTMQDPTTFFMVRLGQENRKTTYTLEKSENGGAFSTIVSNGVVPPPNIGTRSITDPTVGLGAASYSSVMSAANTPTTGGGGETVFCGHSDDPFFMDFGAFSDMIDMIGSPTDSYSRKNVTAIALQIPIQTVQKNGQPVSAATSILDSDYVIGIWASTSQQQDRSLIANGVEAHSGTWIQVSRVGMPMTEDIYIPMGEKNRWLSLTPYNEDPAMEPYFNNPELGLYMDASLFGNVIPAWSALRVQRNSLQSLDFGNTHDGLWPIRATNGGAGTALDTNLFGNYLLRQGQPRSVDLLPLYYTGIPNLAPYHLATGKNGNPLANGKPFMNNFLPTFGDMLRLNMAVPVTPRNDANFSSLGIIQATVIGLAVPPYNTTSNLEFIPNMDGYPNGRRLEDDVTRINLQLASGVLLAEIGFWYDDYISGNFVTQDYVDVLSYTTGIENNDTLFNTSFPYLQTPWIGSGIYDVDTVTVYDHVTITTTITDTIFTTVTDTLIINIESLGLPPNNMNTIKMYPNPASDHLFIDNGNFALMSTYTIKIINPASQEVFSGQVNQQLYDIDLSTWTGTGIYFVQLYDDSNNLIDIRKIVIN